MKKIFFILLLLLTSCLYQDRYPYHKCGTCNQFVDVKHSVQYFDQIRFCYNDRFFVLLISKDSAISYRKTSNDWIDKDYQTHTITCYSSPIRKEVFYTVSGNNVANMLYLCKYIKQD